MGVRPSGVGPGLIFLGRATLQFGYLAFQSFQLLAGASQYGGLNIEFLPGYQVHTGEGRFQRPPQVASEVVLKHRQAGGQTVGDSARKVIEQLRINHPETLPS